MHLGCQDHCERFPWAFRDVAAIVRNDHEVKEAEDKEVGTGGILAVMVHPSTWGGLV